MNLSVEISLYPLQEDYEKPILDFIDNLKANPELDVRVNTMSTQIFGDYDILMSSLSEAMKSTFASELARIMVVKFINADLAPDA